jgi:hypothetical protein
MPSPKKLKSTLTAVAWRCTHKQPTQIKTLTDGISLADRAGVSVRASSPISSALPVARPELDSRNFFRAWSVFR